MRRQRRPNFVLRFSCYLFYGLNARRNHTKLNCDDWEEYSAHGLAPTTRYIELTSTESHRLGLQDRSLGSTKSTVWNEFHHDVFQNSKKTPKVAQAKNDLAVIQKAPSSPHTNTLLMIWRNYCMDICCISRIVFRRHVQFWTKRSWLWRNGFRKFLLWSNRCATATPRFATGTNVSQKYVFDNHKK